MPERNYDVVTEKEFDDWMKILASDEQESVLAIVGLLRQYGVNLDYPYSSKIYQSEYSKMRELRVQHAGRPYRIFYIFNRRRQGVLLTGEAKTDNDKAFYKRMTLKADSIYARHLLELDKEDAENEKTGRAHQ
jgi:hypothetical protein